MKRCLYQTIGMVLMGVMLYSCEPAEESLNEHEVNAVTTAESTGVIHVQEEELPSYFVAMLAEFESTYLNSYLLEFTGRSVQGSGDSETTTFHYRVSGTGETPQLDSFNLSLPDCAGDLVAYTPVQATTISENSIKWNNSVSKDGSQEYSITFAGNVPLGVVSSTVTRGSNEQSYDIVGPCAGVYTLSGSIFIDANNNQIKDASESGISGINITLKEDDIEIGTEITLEDGSYSFMVLAGAYSISVGDDLLNDDNYTASTATSIDLGEVTENSSANNFGYLVNTGKISNDLQQGYYNLNTEPTKFWIQQIRNAGKSNSQYSVAEINSILTEVEGMLLTEPFQFGTNKREVALDILTRPIKTDLDEYLQQLLTAELNIATDRGARNEDESLNTGFNRAMLIYAEAVACREIGTCPDESSPNQAVKTQSKLVSGSDTQMLISFNGSGGLGG